MNTSVIIPVFNEEEHIAKVLDRIPDVDEVIVVDDASSDMTSQMVKEYNVKLLVNNESKGKGYSIRRGVEESQGDFLVFIDGDFQFDPTEIERFLKHTNADLVLGIREEMRGIRKLTNKLSSLGISLSTGRYFEDVLTGFRGCKREVWGKLNLRFNDYRFDVEMIYKALKKGFCVEGIPVTVKYDGEESYISIKDGFKIALFLMRKSLGNLFNLPEM